MSSFQRGFKSWAERLSASTRKGLKLKAHDPLSAFQLADSLRVKLLKPEDIFESSSDHLSQLLRKDGDSWSAVTLCVDNKHIIIYNSAHKPQRQSSDIMHELAHILIGHKPTRFFISPDPNLDIPIRDFDKKQEDEANWLSYCLLLPRAALFHIANSNMPLSEILNTYKVSEKLYQMRLAVTGINVQLKRRSKFIKNFIKP